MSFQYEPHPEFPDVLVITPTVHTDARGDFKELWNNDSFPVNFLQLNLAESQFNVLRGLHYQAIVDGNDHSQNKYVMCTRGVVYDVWVDLRRSSPTFGKWGGKLLGGIGNDILYIPKGFAHGYLCMSNGGCTVQYLVDSPHVPHAERVIRFDDPSLNITWPVLSHNIIVSDKDARGGTLVGCDWFP